MRRAVVIATDPALALRAKFFRGLANPSRLALLYALLGGEQTVGALAQEAGRSQSNVSGHVGCLKDCGLVDSRQEWRHVYYRLADDQIAALLRQADAILARTAQRVFACVNIAEGDERD